jgi:hypothetical protein
MPQMKLKDTILELKSLIGGNTTQMNFSLIEA